MENLFVISVKRELMGFWVTAARNKKGDLSKVAFFDHRISEYYTKWQLREEFIAFLNSIDESYEAFCPDDCVNDLSDFIFEFDLTEIFNNEVTPITISENLSLCTPPCKAAEIFRALKPTKKLALL